MKKNITYLLLFALVLATFSACANESNLKEVEDALQGKWENDGGAYFVFDNGSFTRVLGIPGLPSNTAEGTYEIKKSKIIVNYDNGVEGELEYSFEDGNLILDNNDLIKK